MPGLSHSRIVSPRKGAARAERPDYTMPLRMQSWRGGSDSPLGRLLWKKALKDRCVWQQACGYGLAAGAVQVMCIPLSSQADPWLTALRIAAVLAATVAAGALAGAGMQVRTMIRRSEYSSN